MERVLRHPESLGGSGSPINKPLITPQRPVVLQPGSSGISSGGAGGDGGAPPTAPGSSGNPAVSAEGASKIRAFDQKLTGSARHEGNWNRTPNVTGMGAIHVKSFHAKLTGESLEFLDRQINEWLDAHPQYEVKFVTSTVGDWTGKLKEPNLIVQVWV
ncbi:MAG: hypothetical protein KF678_00830 [Phycisphaeraceae bacterium]|nr:hypothetical protein [Phycisphaeraceae bacterium]